MDFGRRTALALAAAGLVVGAAACSDDDPVAETGDAPTTTAAETTTTGGADGAAGGDTSLVIEVTARNYEFEGVPETVGVGASVSITTEAGGEPHEIVFVKVPDGDDRTLEEFLALPQEELGALFGENVALVTIAMPGTRDTPGVVEGEGTLTEPGRYLYLCTFPQGTTVEDVENATGPLQGDTPPHFVLGMRGELTVE